METKTIHEVESVGFSVGDYITFYENGPTWKIIRKDSDANELYIILQYQRWQRVIGKISYFFSELFKRIKSVFVWK